MLGFQITLIAKSYSHFCHSDALFYMHCQQLERPAVVKNNTTTKNYYQVHTLFDKNRMRIVTIKQLDSRAPSEFENKLSIIHA